MTAEAGENGVITLGGVLAWVDANPGLWYDSASALQAFRHLQEWHDSPELVQVLTDRLARTLTYLRSVQETDPIRDRVVRLYEAELSGLTARFANPDYPGWLHMTDETKSALLVNAALN